MMFTLLASAGPGEYLSYEAITSAANNMVFESSSVLTGAMYGVKGIAILFILLTWMKNYIEGLKDPENHRGISWDKIFFGILYVLLVINCDYISNVADGVLGSYEKSFNISASTEMYSFTESWITDMQDEIIEEEEEKGFWSNIIDKVSGFASSAKDLFVNFGDIWWWLFLVIKGIAWFVNLIVYPIFLLERSFLLMLMKFAMPLILALGALKSYRKLVSRWLALYCAVFITGLFFILATQFCDQVFGGIVMDSGIINANDSKALLFIVIAFAKAKLYKGGKDLADKLFNV